MELISGFNVDEATRMLPWQNPSSLEEYPQNADRIAEEAGPSSTPPSSCTPLWCIEDNAVAFQTLQSCSCSCRSSWMRRRLQGAPTRGMPNAEAIEEPSSIVSLLRKRRRWMKKRFG